MKKLAYYFVLVIFTAFFVSACCSTKTISTKGKVWVPVYKTLDEIRNGVKAQGAEDINIFCKIYIYGQYLFITDKGTGVHIFDNSNPANPQQLSFVAIPGNQDVAVKNNIMYADNYLDLVAFDISNPSAPKFVKRLENVFPNLLDMNNSYVDPKLGIVTNWVEKDTIYSYTYNECAGSSPVSTDGTYGGSTKDGVSSGSGGRSTSSSGGATGIGGSTERFTIVGAYLYIVDNTNLQVIDISNTSNPRIWAKANIGWSIETVYPVKDKLFIGSQTGMFIYDISTPWNPTFVANFSHARACDPVVATDKYAYITTRSNSRCAGNNNQLSIVDISNITSPKLVKAYPMQNPAGLGYDNNTLFVCDGEAGLKVFDVTNPSSISLLSWVSELNFGDIIPLGLSAIVVGVDGVYQYNYTDPKNLKQISKIGFKTK
ncbi:MAG: hypothetical protein NT007_09285 [Candidatus Kapabacteria bacterium]|nr:hypothetical protein [Candidatus Kapabacteria bacterium]